MRHPPAFDDVPEPWKWRALRGFVDVELHRVGRSLHVWFGPAGLHIFWPEIWKSRPGWCPHWREPLD